MTTATELSTDGYRRIAILCALAKHPLIESAELSKRTNIPDISVKRHLARLRNDFMVDIVFVRSSGVRGKSGGYEVRDWGIIDKDELLSRYGDLVPEHAGESFSHDIPIKPGAATKATAKKSTTKKQS